MTQEMKELRARVSAYRKAEKEWFEAGDEDAPFPPPIFCDCERQSDSEMDRVINGILRMWDTDGRRSRFSDSAIVRALGELEATDHLRTCTLYGVFLEACEARGW
jgi:hypothetical protein